MPHLSKRKINDKTVRELEGHISSIVKCPVEKVRVQIFNELLTKTEKIMIAKRLAIVLLLKKKISIYKVSEILGISKSTAVRYQVDLSRGKYRRTAEWLWKQTDKGARDELIKSLVRLAFTGKTKSFKQFVDEF